MSDDAERQEIIRRRVRFVVPAREPWGLAIKDLQRAIREALAHREARGLSNDYDDAIRVLVEDSDGGEIVLFYDVEEPIEPVKNPSRLGPCPHAEEHAFTVRSPGTMEGLETWHRLTVEVHCCGRTECQSRLKGQIQNLTGVKTVIEPYPTR